MSGSIDLMRKHLKPEFKPAYLKALRKTRTRLATRGRTVSPYICDNLFAVTRDNPEASYPLSYWIRELLENRFSLEGWLVHHGHMRWQYPRETPYASTTRAENKERVQATRLAWLDWMIQHVEEHL